MDIIFSANNHLAKLLEAMGDFTMERLPCLEGKKVGVQPLKTQASQVSWQCNLVKESARRTSFIIIATEAYSRYTIILPFDYPPTAEDITHEIIQRWGAELINHMLLNGIVNEGDIEAFVEQYESTERMILWYRNTDLSVNNHIADAGFWLDNYRQQCNVDQIDVDDAMAIGMHINDLTRKSKGADGKKESFIPVPRFVDDGLYRFAQGLNRGGNFACPYSRDANLSPEVPELPDNVISFDAARQKRQR